MYRPLAMSEEETDRMFGQFGQDEGFTLASGVEFEEPTELVDHPLEPIFTPSPEMLSRFLRVDRLNDPLRYEAGIAISEGRVQQGEDIVRRKILEEDWQWNITLLSTTAMYRNESWEWSNSIEKGRGMESDCMESDCMEDGCMKDHN